MVVSKKRGRLTFEDRLSRLSLATARTLLGTDGDQLIREGGRYEIEIDEHVERQKNLLRLRLRDAVAEIRLDDRAKSRLAVSCSRCEVPCVHVGAVLSVVLEEKMLLGLSVPPPEEMPFELRSEEDLVRLAIEEREQRARTERMRLRSSDPETPWTDYAVTSAASGKTYRVALRGLERGESYCTCPDFRKNTLGTCKHVLHVLAKAGRKFSRDELAKKPRPKAIALYLEYGEVVGLRLLAPAVRDAKLKRLIDPMRDRVLDDASAVVRWIRRVERQGREVLIYPDAERWLDERLWTERMAELVEEIRANPKGHPLRTELLEVELLPYQLDGIAFAVGAGRAVLADDMGLGKTIQAVGVAELLAREAGIRRVLVVCPASLKSQWAEEIARFSRRGSQVVYGSASERPAQYRTEEFFTICNYEQVMRDLPMVEAADWDLIVLDEGQRIKNWEAKTSRSIKSLVSRFALVLSGTPLENRVDELFSIMEFIEPRRLGPAFRFFHRHRTVDEYGRVHGYKNLDELRERLAPVLLRRTRQMVLRELPPRTTSIVRIPATEEQLVRHQHLVQLVRMITEKKYLTEMDLMRLQRTLMMCRMVADSTILVDKEGPAYSSKLEKLDEMFETFAGEEDRKIVVFSEWTGMLDLVEGVLDKHGIDRVRLDGKVPQKKRQVLVNRFQRDAECRVFLATNAGMTGLNLQAADTVVNVDLPWNPAVLEQRIGRAHRMGQKRPVQVYVLVTEGTIEERLLGTLAAKHDLALAALDPDSTVKEVQLEGGIEELRRRMERLIGAAPDGEIDESQRRDVEEEARDLAARSEGRAARKQKVARAGGELLRSALSFVAAALPAAEERSGAGRSGEEPARDEEREKVAEAVRESLRECAEETPEGGLRLELDLPDAAAMEDLTRALAGIVQLAGSGGEEETGGRPRSAPRKRAGRRETRAKKKNPTRRGPRGPSKN